MAEGSTDGVVFLSALADIDFREIQSTTTLLWGWKQAQRYSDFLEMEMRKVALDPKMGKLVEGHASARTIFVKWPKAKHGHYIVYRIVPIGIEVMRLLHGARNLPDHLELGKDLG